MFKRPNQPDNPVTLSPPVDFQVTDHGSLCLLHPKTDEAYEWAGAHLPCDAQTWGTGIVVEPRYMAAIVDGIQADGLSVL